MDKKQLHHLWTIVRRIKPVYFLAACAVFGLIGVAALRANNLHMVQLRNAVYTADEKNGDTEAALQKLRAYVGSHMNTSLSTGNGVYPPIQLKYTYQRLVQAAGQQTTDANSALYSQAQQYCEAQIPTGFSGRYRLSCIEQYIDAHGSGAVTTIPDSLYKFDFATPAWSPDLAGLSLAAAAICLLLSAVSFASGRLLKYWAK